MIYLLSKTIESKITALNFVERYGGQAIPITADFPSEEGPNRQTFPVSCNLSSIECFEQDKYKNLLPNQSYKSVCYIEELSQSNIDFDGPKSVYWNTILRFRVVCWLNFLKLGFDDCKGTDRFALALIKAVLNQGKQYAIDRDGIKGALKIISAKVVEKDHRNIFGRYSYNAMTHLFFWPYDYFAAEFQAAVTISGGCIDDLELGEEIECLTNW